MRDTLEVHSTQIAQTQNDLAENKEAIANASVNVDVRSVFLSMWVFHFNILYIRSLPLTISESISSSRSFSP